MPQGCSDIVFDLQDFMAIPRDAILYAWFEDKAGNQLVSSVQHLRMERHMRFPNAHLSVSVEKNELIVTTDQYAHCVEIEGNANGRADGWFFQDNYFDLMPWEIKRVRILGHHREGTIFLKAHYAKEGTTINYKLKGEV